MLSSFPVELSPAHTAFGGSQPSSTPVSALGTPSKLAPAEKSPAARQTRAALDAADKALASVAYPNSNLGPAAAAGLADPANAPASAQARSKLSASADRAVAQAFCPPGDPVAGKAAHAETPAAAQTRAALAAADKALAGAAVQPSAAAAGTDAGPGGGKEAVGAAAGQELATGLKKSAGGPVQVWHAVPEICRVSAAQENARGLVQVQCALLAPLQP